VGEVHVDRDGLGSEAVLGLSALKGGGREEIESCVELPD
jgi:hypothetical protein